MNNEAALHLTKCAYGTLRRFFSSALRFILPKSFVGVFDSGVGGLTVLNELKKVAPMCNYVYVADHAFCPYGTKRTDEICSRVFAVAHCLKQMGAQSLVVACNTASLFVAPLRRNLQLPVFDVIYPTCCAIFEHTYVQKVAILATNATAKSGVYNRILGHFGVQSEAFACSEFVTLSEDCASACERKKTVTLRLKNLKLNRFDAVVLGCTHFPLLLDEISSCTGKSEIISCSQPVAKFFAQSSPTFGSGKTLCFTTGDVFEANMAARWCGAEFNHISI